MKIENSPKNECIKTINFGAPSNIPSNKRNIIDNISLSNNRELLTNAGKLNISALFSYANKRYDEALTFINDALLSLKILGEVPEAATLYNTNGMILYAQGQQEEAVKMYNSAIKIIETFNYQLGPLSSVVFYNIAKIALARSEVAQDRGEQSEASKEAERVQEYLIIAIHIATQESSDSSRLKPIDMAAIYDMMAIALRIQNYLQLAEEYHDKAIYEVSSELPTIIEIFRKNKEATSKKLMTNWSNQRDEIQIRKKISLRVKQLSEAEQVRKEHAKYQRIMKEEATKRTVNITKSVFYEASKTLQYSADELVAQGKDDEAERKYDKLQKLQEIFPYIDFQAIEGYKGSETGLALSEQPEPVEKIEGDNRDHDVGSYYNAVPRFDNLPQFPALPSENALPNNSNILEDFAVKEEEDNVSHSAGSYYSAMLQFGNLSQFPVLPSRTIAKNSSPEEFIEISSELESNIKRGVQDGTRQYQKLCVEGLELCNSKNFNEALLKFKDAKCYAADNRRGRIYIQRAFVHYRWAKYLESTSSSDKFANSLNQCTKALKVLRYFDTQGGSNLKAESRELKEYINKNIARLAKIHINIVS